jgi:hypothetical protein
MIMKKDICYFLTEHTEFELLSFFPYPSGVRHQLLSQSHNYESEEHTFLDEFGELMLKEFENETGFRRDNKIVIEFTPVNFKDNEKYSSLFLGYKDNVFSIGLGAFQVDKREPISLIDSESCGGPTAKIEWK